MILFRVVNIELNYNTIYFNTMITIINKVQNNFETIEKYN